MSSQKPKSKLRMLTYSDATRGFGNHFWDVPVTNIEGLRKVRFQMLSVKSLLISIALLHLPNYVCPDTGCG